MIIFAVFTIVLHLIGSSLIMRRGNNFPRFVVGYLSFSILVIVLYSAGLSYITHIKLSLDNISSLLPGLIILCVTSVTIVSKLISNNKDKGPSYLSYEDYDPSIKKAIVDIIYILIVSILFSYFILPFILLPCAVFSFDIFIINKFPSNLRYLIMALGGEIVWWNWVKQLSKPGERLYDERFKYHILFLIIWILIAAIHTLLIGPVSMSGTSILSK